MVNKRSTSTVILIILILSAAVYSFPRLSVEQASRCNQCHINPNGGGMRNEFGNYATALNELSLPQTKQIAVDNYKKPRLSDALLIGFDTRYLVLDDGSIFKMQTDFFGDLTPWKNLHYNFRIGETGISENFLMLESNNHNLYVKAGRFYPAFGLRNSDHTAFNRERTGHSSLLYLDGISAGYSFNDLSVAAELFDRNNQSVYGLHLYQVKALGDFGLMGGISLRLSEEINGSNLDSPHAKALFGGISYDRFTLLGELDLVGKGNDTLISYLNLTTRLEYGLYLIGEYNFFDGNRDLKTGVEEFIRVSVEFYPISFIQLRPSYTRYTKGGYEKDNFFLQIHAGY